MNTAFFVECYPLNRSLNMILTGCSQASPFVFWSAACTRCSSSFPWRPTRNVDARDAPPDRRRRRSPDVRPMTWRPSHCWRVDAVEACSRATCRSGTMIEPRAFCGTSTQRASSDAPELTGRVALPTFQCIILAHGRRRTRGRRRCHRSRSRLHAIVRSAWFNPRQQVIRQLRSRLASAATPNL
jgi:hypothetical protein